MTLRVLGGRGDLGEVCLTDDLDALATLVCEKGTIEDLGVDIDDFSNPLFPQILYARSSKRIVW